MSAQGFAFGLILFSAGGFFYMLKRKEWKIDSKIKHQEAVFQENKERIKRLGEIHEKYFKEQSDSNISKSVQSEEARIIDQNLKRFLEIQEAKENIRNRK